jgi:DNA modification methylase
MARLFNELWEDCHRRFPHDFFDLIIVDPPYGKTNLPWDKPFNTSDFLRGMLSILSPTGTILVFGRNPELSKYIIYGEDIFKYDLTWIKSRKNGYVNCNTKPLQQTEHIAVFSKAHCINKHEPKMTYNPLFIRPCFRTAKQPTVKQRYNETAGGFVKTKDGVYIPQEGHKEYPTDVIEISSIGKHDHPCKKPVELYEYLILTYSNLGDKVFDPCFGSGSSLVAGKGLNRKMFGCEMDKVFYDIAMDKLK